MFPFCSNCAKELPKGFLTLIDTTNSGDMGAGYYCNDVCLKQWLEKHR